MNPTPPKPKPATPKPAKLGPGALTDPQRAILSARAPARLALVGRTVPPATVAAPTRADRTRIVCKLYGAPLDLTEEILAAHLTVKEVFALLAAACGDRRELSPAGTVAVRLGLQAHAGVGESTAQTAETARRRAVVDLCRRHGVDRTFLAQALVNSGHPLAVLEPLLQSRANPCGLVPPGVHAGLVRDICLIRKDAK